MSNDPRRGQKVLSVLENELSRCTAFEMSVAFITLGGITPLLQTLKELQENGIQGRILTTDYLHFSDPAALDKLDAMDNVELRMYRCQDSVGFHTKGYLFRNGLSMHILIGSSNLTQSALTRNKEWNTEVLTIGESEYAKSVEDEFHTYWEAKQTQPYAAVRTEYRQEYYEQKRTAPKPAPVKRLVPNTMQKGLIHQILKAKQRHEHKGLLISATGTGKTYAAAFAMQELNVKHVLFLVHREQIARQAMASFQNVFKNTRTFGLLSGHEKNFSAEYLFSTMQTMAQKDIRSRFDPAAFDVIIIDEVHRAGAPSYQTIMNYFTPAYWLGMSASPERTDGFDIYQLFDHHILYEIRLQQALEEDFLCPFHYFGIRDLELDGRTIDDTSTFAALTDDLRVDYILKQAAYYGYSGARVKGLIFCRTVAEAKTLSAKFNARGLHTEALSGEDPQEYRETCIRRLTQEELEDHLDYLFSVDIFNEGVDIPEINQVILLRPTQSVVIFVQQLGRGLRKAKGKEFVVVIDFIGNYKNNFMIPMALSGDRSYNKDTVRHYLQEGSRIIPGSSTLHFDPITRQRIYESIDMANFNDLRLIKEAYQQLRFKLGRIPDLKDFDIYGAIDPIRIFDQNSLGSYHCFLKKYEKAYKTRFTPLQEHILEFLSRKFGAGKRPHELILVKYALAGSNQLIRDTFHRLRDQYQIVTDDRTRINLVNLMTNNFASGSAKNRYADCILIQECGSDYCASDAFAQALNDPSFRQEVSDLVEFGLHRCRQKYAERYENTSFCLYAKYTYEDVCRLLEWEKNQVPLNIGGYKYDERTKTYPVFINYDKEDDIAATIKYADRLLAPDRLLALSKSNRTEASEDVQIALHAKKLGVQMDLFIRKNKNDANTAKEFYYMGKIQATGHCHEIMMPGTDAKAVEIEYKLKTPIQDDLYDYIVNR